MTIGTCGPTTFASSVPDGPLSQWENKLRQRLARRGSTECSLTWKASDTPGGRSLSRLVPSMRPTVEIAFGSSPSEPALWVTASARDWKDSPGMTTTRPDGRSRIDQLPRQVAAAMWPSPVALDTMARTGMRPSREATGRTTGYLSEAVVSYGAAQWPTPCARDHMPAHTAEYIAEKKAQGHGMSVLPDYAAHAIAATGITAPGSLATTEKPGALAPEFVAWLMGFPQEWLDCAPETMPRKAKLK